MLTLFAQSKTMQEILDFLQDRGLQFALNLVLAILIFVIGKWVAGILTGVIERAIRRGKLDDTLSKFFANIAYILMLAFVILAALDRLGVSTTSLAAIIAAAGLAVGLALQSSLANFAAGVMLIAFRPIRVGHYVEVAGVAGTVEEIRMFHTILKSPDNIRIIVPNGEITTDKIKNYSANETRRIDLVIGCGYDDDLKAVKEFLMQLLQEDERILKDPAPVVAVDELGDNSVNFVVRPWVKRSDYFATKTELLEKIKLGMDERGFTLPYPQQDVHLYQESGEEKNETGLVH